MAAYDGLNKDPEKIQVFVLDLTNDRTPELLLQKFPYLFIFGCDAGKYKIILQLGKELGDIYIYALQDYNRNGVPEIIFRWNTFISPFHEPWYSYYFLEWDGDDFKSILTNDQVRDDGLEINNNSSNLSFVTIQGQSIATDAENRNTWEINDYDNNGLKDIRIVGGLPESDYRSRQVILTLSWNGKEYSPSSIFHKAVFRIDVVQDADAAFLLGNYEQALSLYAEVIQNENLLEWGYPGDEKYDRFTFRKIAQAYAYYRIMLTHAVQGNPDDALINYNALRTQFANDEKTKPYVEMSTRFWDDYQSTMDVASACAQVVNYVKANPDMLLPFTIAWNEEYQPKGFCPVE